MKHRLSTILTGRAGIIMSYKVLITFDLPDADAFPSVLIEALTATEVVALGQL